MKIKFAGYWNNDYNIYLIINDIWNIDGSFSEVLTYGDDYTHLVIMNYVNKSLYRIDQEKTYGIVIEPYWSDNFDKNMLSYCKKIVTYQPEKYDQSRIIFAPLLGNHRLYDTSSDGGGEIQPRQGTTKDIISSKFEKSKKLSVIVSNAYDGNRSYTNYGKRLSLVKKLLDSDLDFDMYGRGWNLLDKRYKGPLVNKINGIKDYCYSLCLENSSISGNITEKFIDCILCDTVPIYNGHREIEKFYPGSYEYMEYDGSEVDRIRSIINNGKTHNDYSIAKAKDLYLNTYNPIRIISNDIIN